MTSAWRTGTWLIARREIDERLRARSFWITTAIMIIEVAAAVVVPALLSNKHATEKVGVLGVSDPALTQAAIAAGRVSGDKVHVAAVANLETARAALRAGTLAAVIIDRREILIKQQSAGGTTSSIATFTRALAQFVGGPQFTVHHIDLVGRLGHGAQPRQNLVGIGMGRSRLQLHDFRLHRYITPMNTHGFATTGQRGAARAGDLEAGQDDHVAVVARVESEVMQYTPTGGHAAG